MNRLTHERVNGIKTGYWSQAKKEELIQRLAAYENTGLEPEEIMGGKLLTGWISVSEGLPPEPDEFRENFNEYIVMIKGAKLPTALYYAGDGEWEDINELPCPVIAWMPMPEPYKEDEHD